MKKRILIAAVSIAIVLVLLGITGITKLQASQTMPVTTQGFTPARYALAAAEINVANLQGGGRACTRKVLIRMDSVTGKAQILQMSVRGDGDPTVLSAVWAPTEDSGPFQLFGAQQQSNGF